MRVKHVFASTKADPTDATLIKPSNWNEYHTVEDWFDVKSYGAVGNGIVDDATAIQAAIDAIPANGGEVYFPAGTYKINSQITLGNGSAGSPSTRNGIRLLGAGQSKVPGSGATTLLWGGGAARMFLIEGPIQGVEFGHLNLDCNSVATIGIEARSVRGSSFHDLTIHNHVTYGFVGTVQTGAAEGSFNTSVRRIQISSLGTSATGILLHGDAGVPIDWTESTFDTVLIFFHGGPSSKGLHLGFTDGNVFTKFHAVAQNNSGGPCIHIDASIAPATFPNSNRFDDPTLSANGIAVSGTPGQNCFPGYDTGNGAAVPTSLTLAGWTRENVMFGLWHLLCRATRSTAQTITNNSPTKVIFNAEDFDTGAMHDPGSNPTRVTIPVTGKYRVSAGVTWESSSTGSRRVRVLVDDAAIPGLADFKAADAQSSCSMATIVPLTAGDIVELEAFQNSGGDLDIDSVALTVEHIP